MNSFDVNTGNPPPRRRYQVSYCLRPRDTGKSWLAGSMVVISRSSETATLLVKTMMEDGHFEYKFVDCEDITDARE